MVVFRDELGWLCLDLCCILCKLSQQSVNAVKKHTLISFSGPCFSVQGSWLCKDAAAQLPRASAASVGAFGSIQSVLGPVASGLNRRGAKPKSEATNRKMMDTGSSQRQHGFPIEAHIRKVKSQGLTIELEYSMPPTIQAH